MTSPSQLHYLKAMGIPVWVSRELIVVTKGDEQNTNDKSADLEAVTNSVNSILQNLDSVADNKSKSPQIIEDSHPSKEDAPNPVTNDLPQHSHTETQSKTLIASTTQHRIYATGGENAEWMVIGQSPEFISNDNDQPFAHDSGDLLNNMLRAVGLENLQQQAYLLNILPLSQTDDANDNDSHQALNNELLKIIRKVNPKILLIVGQLAAQNLLQSKEPLARLRAKPHQLLDFNIPLVVTYYPSYLLHKPSDKRKAWEDLKLAMRLLDQ